MTTTGLTDIIIKWQGKRMLNHNQSILYKRISEYDFSDETDFVSVYYEGYSFIVNKIGDNYGATCIDEYGPFCVSEDLEYLVKAIDKFCEEGDDA